MPRLEGVDGNPILTLGCAEAEVGIAAGVYKMPVVVNAKKEKPNFTIGADCLVAHDCDLSLRHKVFTMGKDSVECIPKWVRASHARLKLARWVELTPHTEVLVSFIATLSIKHFGMASLNTLGSTYGIHKHTLQLHNQLTIAGGMPRIV